MRIPLARFLPKPVRPPILFGEARSCVSVVPSGSFACHSPRRPSDTYSHCCSTDLAVNQRGVVPHPSIESLSCDKRIAFLPRDYTRSVAPASHILHTLRSGSNDSLQRRGGLAS